MKKFLFTAGYVTAIAFLLTLGIGVLRGDKLTAHAQTTPTPTLFFYCAGSCPQLTPSATPLPANTTPFQSGGQQPTTPPKQQGAPKALTEPCESTVSIQRSRGHKKWKHKHRRGMGNFSIEKLLEWINRILERLGMAPITLPSQPTEPTPTVPTTQPTAEPTVPSQPDPTEEPCITPTEVEEQPTEEPAEPTQPEPTVQPTVPTTQPTTSTTGGRTDTVKITFYGAWDNDPPGSTDIAYPVIHDKAGGTGTYQDPLTFASPAGDGAYPVGQIIYVPMVQKYFIKEDQCAVSWTAPDGCGAVTMVDLYVGNPSGAEAVVECENSLTPDGNTEIIVDPPADLTVSSELLWDEATGTCASL